MNNKFPANHQAVMPYLIVNNANGLIVFLVKVFNAVEVSRHMRDEHTIMHAEVMIEGCTLMISDSTSEFAPQNAGMFVYVPDADSAYEVALSNDAKSLMPPADQPYGRSCGVLDAFGNTWWITSFP